jgi:GTP-binding protein YchF
MKIGMLGLPQVGKKTLFELLTNHKPSENEIVSGKPIKSMAEVKDARFDWLVDIYKPKKEVRARIDMELLPKLEKDTIAKGDIFNDIADADALCHVVRAFEDDSVYHVDGSVDPKRDIDKINSELILYDLIFIEKRIERIDKKAKVTKDEASIKEKEFLATLKIQLDKELPLRLLDFTHDDKKMMTSYPFVTRKDMLVVLNVAEDKLSDTSLLEKLRADYASLKIGIMQVSAKVESEIVKLESAEERRDFMQSLGIAEPAINILTALLLKSLNLLSFFTVGQDEVRQWLVRAGSTAPEAAGVIHTDLQKGFIRAEVFKYNDVKALGGEDKVKAAGKFYVKGKDYIVEEGDILNIRFNV